MILSFWHLLNSQSVLVSFISYKTSLPAAEKIKLISSCAAGKEPTESEASVEQMEKICEIEICGSLLKQSDVESSLTVC